MRNKKTIILLLLIAIVGVVGLTLAYFANTASIENQFNTKQYGTTVDEVFTSPDDWTPGTTTPKTLIVTNSGQVDEAVRVSYTETWTSANSNVEGDLGLSQGNNRAAIINFANSSDWTKVTENNKDYYYYNYKLAPGEVTSTLLESVTFNSAITNSSNCVTESTSTGKTVTCTSTGDGYDGATYKLTFTVETVQYDKYGEAWNTNVSIANSSKPLMVKGLKVNSVDKTYETGDRGEMFAFTHPETEQMKATTDYRYIGNIPNNYVKFNCDNDGTNCEIWRIIGVFEVDDGTGKYETRIKLVRGSAFADEMQWDNRTSEYFPNDNYGKNEWDGSKINEFLNGDYLSRTGEAKNFGLKDFAQSQVDNSKFYLGGRSINTTNHYGTTEDIYNWERGIITFSEREKSWIGKVALMYPSDNYYIYAKGVDDNCYNDPQQCYIYGKPAGVPNNGWIYSSNTLDGRSGEYTDNLFNIKLQSYSVWLLSTDSGQPTDVFSISVYGSTGSTMAYNLKGIRPVVYLKSSINIISGEGTEQNPYVLG